VLAPSDFSVLKNFVRKPVHGIRSKFFQWFKITSNQFTVNDVICDVVFVNNNTANSLLMNFDFPVDTSSSTHSSCHAEQTPNQLPRFHCQRPVASKFTWLEPLGLPGLEGNVGGLSQWQAPSETENDRRTEGSPAGDLGQPTSGTNRQSCQRVLKATEVLQLCVDISNIHSNCNVATLLVLLERC